MSDEVRNVVVIGSGPAGLTAAIYAARANLRPLIVEGGMPKIAGGQMRETMVVENYPGFAAGVHGNDLMDQMRLQAERVGTEFVTENVDRVELGSQPFYIRTDGGQEIRSKTVIIATGSSPRTLGLASETALNGRGISSSAISDGFFFREKDVVVVGGGDAALEVAIFMTRMASKVTVIHRRDVLRASRIMQQRAFDNPKIAFVGNSVVDEIHDPAGGWLTGVTISDVDLRDTHFIPAQGLFISIGHTPNTKLFDGQVDMDPGGYLLTLPGRPVTNVPGVFAAGDVQDTLYKQAVTAASSGCMAAIEAERYLHAGGH